MENLLLSFSFFVSVVLVTGSVIYLIKRRKRLKKETKAHIIYLLGFHEFSYDVMDSLLSKECYKCKSREKSDEKVHKKIEELLKKL